MEESSNRTRYSIAHTIVLLDKTSFFRLCPHTPRHIDAQPLPSPSIFKHYYPCLQVYPISNYFEHCDLVLGLFRTFEPTYNLARFSMTMGPAAIGLRHWTNEGTNLSRSVIGPLDCCKEIERRDRLLVMEGKMKYKIGFCTLVIVSFNRRMKRERTWFMQYPKREGTIMFHHSIMINAITRRRPKVFRPQTRDDERHHILW